jgi:hypothetical protein
VPDDGVRRVAADAGLDRQLAPAAGIPAAVAVAAERFEESNASRARWFETRLKAAEKQLAVAWGEVEKARRQASAAARTTDRLKAAAYRTPIGRALQPSLRRAKRLARRVVRRVRG